MIPVLFLGIDPSISNTGAVSLDAEGRIVQSCEGKRYCLEGNLFQWDIQKYAAQALYIETYLLAYRYDIVYEDYSFGSTHRAYALAEFGGILKARLLPHANSFTLVSPTRVKLFACGTGTASKEDMLAAARSEQPAFFTDNVSFDVCDAYFMAKLAWYLHSPAKAARLEKGTRLLRSRLEIIKKMQGEQDGKTSPYNRTARAQRGCGGSRG